jgi:glucose-6-phosphate isomerase
MQDAITTYRSVSVSPEFREAERLRSLAKHNEAATLRNAENKGRDKGRTEGYADLSAALRELGVSPDIIAKANARLKEAPGN